MAQRPPSLLNVQSGCHVQQTHHPNFETCLSTSVIVTVLVYPIIMLICANKSKQVYVLLVISVNLKGWEDMHAACFKLLSWHSPGGSEENHKNIRTFGIKPKI
jgi:hypothetical protein